MKPYIGLRIDVIMMERISDRYGSGFATASGAVDANCEYGPFGFYLCFLRTLWINE